MDSLKKKTITMVIIVEVRRAFIFSVRAIDLTFSKLDSIIRDEIRKRFYITYDNFGIYYKGENILFLS